MGLLTDTIEKILNSILHKAKERNVPVACIDILVYNEAAEINKIKPKYGFMVKQQLIEANISFNKVLNMSFDPYFMLGGSGKLAEPFIREFMQRKCTEYKINPLDIKLHIVINENYQNELAAFDEKLKQLREYSYEWEQLNNQKNSVRPLRAFIYRNNEKFKEMKIDEILEKA